MVSGTPAVSFRQGSAPELIEPGITGFVVDDIREMVDAVGESYEVDPFDCARVARERFSPRVMAGSYLRLYTCALAGAPARPTTIEALKRLSA